MSEADPENEQVAAVLQRCGAEPATARTMAAQLLKRAEQLAVERGIGRLDALQYLLQLAIQGAHGDAPPGFEGGKPSQER